MHLCEIWVFFTLSSVQSSDIDVSSSFDQMEADVLSDVKVEMAEVMAEVALKHDGNVLDIVSCFNTMKYSQQ